MTPAQRAEMLKPGWLREEVAKAVLRVKQLKNAHRCTCHLRDPGANNIEQRGYSSSEPNDTGF